MPTNQDPLAAYIIAETLLQCAQNQLTETWAGYPDLVPTDTNGDPAPVPPRSCVIAGAIAWEDCECGQLLITINSQWGSKEFPSVMTGDFQRCGAPIHVIEYIVSMLRCAPVGSGAAPPSCDELAVAAQIALIDAWAIRVGVQCCLSDMRTRGDDGVKEIERFAVAENPIDGPEGGCMGSALRVTVGINGGCPCPEES